MCIFASHDYLANDERYLEFGGLTQNVENKEKQITKEYRMTLRCKNCKTRKANYLDSDWSSPNERVVGRRSQWYLCGMLFIIWLYCRLLKRNILDVYPSP